MGRISDELQTSDTQQPTAVLRAVDKLIQFNERMQQQLVSAEKKLEDQAQQIVTHSVEGSPMLSQVWQIDELSTAS